MTNGEFFTLRARKCLRCGRLLTSEKALELGYGCRCAEIEGVRPPHRELPGQIDILECMGEGKTDGADVRD